MKPVVLPENTREILKSRVNQLETKMNEKENQKVEQHVRPQTRDWIQQMSEELRQRMTTEKTSVDDQTLQSSSSSRPKCVRCEADVTAMDRISVSGEVLHRF